MPNLSGSKSRPYTFVGRSPVPIIVGPVFFLRPGNNSTSSLGAHAGAGRRRATGSSLSYNAITRVGINHATLGPAAAPLRGRMDGTWEKIACVHF